MARRGAPGFGGRVYLRDTEPKNNFTVHIRPEQKSVQFMQELVHRFLQPQNTVLDKFAGTISTAVAFI